MSSTTFVDVPAGTWTEILTAGLTALISNEGGNSLVFVEKTTASGAPVDAELKGHSLNNREKITLTTPALQSIYARSIGDAATRVAITAA